MAGAAGGHAGLGGVGSAIDSSAAAAPKSDKAIGFGDALGNQKWFRLRIGANGHFDDDCPKYVAGHDGGPQGPLVWLNANGTRRQHAAGSVAANTLCLCGSCELWDLTFGPGRWASAYKKGIRLVRKRARTCVSVRTACRKRTDAKELPRMRASALHESRSSGLRRGMLAVTLVKEPHSR